MPVPLVILSDVRLYREGLAMNVMNRGSAVDVVGACGDADAARAMVELHPGTVVLVDVSLRDLEAALRRLKSEEPIPRLVALALTRASDDQVVAAAEQGFDGLVPSDASVEELIAVVERAARGEWACTPAAAGKLARRVAALARGSSPSLSSHGLTERELEVAKLLADGLSNKQIARQLSIRLATVKNHVHNILSKLNVERRGEVMAAMRSGAVPAGGPPSGVDAAQLPRPA